MNGRRGWGWRRVDTSLESRCPRRVSEDVSVLRGQGGLRVFHVGIDCRKIFFLHQVVHRKYSSSGLRSRIEVGRHMKMIFFAGGLLL